MKLRSLSQDVFALDEAIQLSQILLKVGEGRVPADDGSCIYVLQYIQKLNICEELCNYIYKIIDENHSDKECLKNRAIITTRNMSVQSINKIVGIKFLGEPRTFSSADKV